MRLRFIFSETAKSDITHLPAEVRERIGKKLRQLESQSGIVAQLKKLNNNPSAQFRLRVGDYRILLDKEGNTLYVLRVRHRREAYRK